jgi:septal ring factor EnvC (AmiA/AmiB activator)
MTKTLQRQIHDLNEQASSLSEAKAQALSDLKQMHADTAVLRHELSAVRQREAALQKQVMDLSDRLNSEQQQVALLRGHLDGMREMLDRSNGKPPLMRVEPGFDLPRMP